LFQVCTISPELQSDAVWTKRSFVPSWLTHIVTVSVLVAATAEEMPATSVAETRAAATAIEKRDLAKRWYICPPV
jgi:predicted lipid carrier protein YhbT